MEYTITELAKIAGISTRTLRFYDQIGLLKPAGTNASGYRVYGSSEIDLLQQIMYYRELGVNLAGSKKLCIPKISMSLTLLRSTWMLIEERDRLDRLIENVNKTIDYKEGRIFYERQRKV